MTTIAEAGTLDVRPLERTLGGAVIGLDLHEELDERTVAGLRAALLERKVLVFPEARLSPDELERFSRYLGEPFADPSYPYGSIPENPYVVALGPSDPGHRASSWHQGGTWKPNPWFFEMLQINVKPDVGGDTLWADLQAAYRDLSPYLQAYVGSLRAAHLRQVAYEHSAVADEAPTVDHPLVLTHPETGQKGLYLTSRIVQLLDVPKPESDAVLAFLRAHASHVKYQFRHRWARGDLVVWDNRATWHYAVDDYGNDLRHGHKISIEGGDWRPA
jgi:alpha-ketoglutarate-dependent taurine dioxygenase